MIRRSVTLITLLVIPAALGATKIPACPSGRYLLAAGDDGLIFGDQTPTTDAVMVAATTLSTPTCGPAHAKPKGTKKGTVVRATWKKCGSFKKVVATATITDNCATMTGTIKAKKVPARAFTAHLSTGCGDHLVDKGLGEQCEGDADCDVPGATCAKCACEAPPPTTTTTPAGSTTTTPTSSSTTTTTLAGCQPSTDQSGVCGNCIVDPGETCDDGNTIDGDFCPHDCVIQSCVALPDSPRTFSVGFTPPPGVQVAGIAVLVDYPEGRVVIPGSGQNVVGSITHVPFGKLSTPNDLDYALIEAVVGATPIAPGRLFTITFEDCAGSVAPLPADFSCTVTDAADQSANPIDPTTISCAVTSP